MLPPNVTIKRKAPGTYGVYRRYRAGTGLVGIMLGDVQGHAGDVQRDRATGKWTATPSGTTLPVTTGHPSRDAAAAALFARPPADG